MANPGKIPPGSKLSVLPRRKIANGLTQVVRMQNRQNGRIHARHSIALDVFSALLGRTVDDEIVACTAAGRTEFVSDVAAIRIPPAKQIANGGVNA